MYFSCYLTSLIKQKCV
uniref:Uncharacterized protein n=1 Tax=Rhizophora mucronata TaxID=61149 RepID=A0A2P2N958_RHIMU